MAKETGPILTGDLLNPRTLGVKQDSLLTYTRKPKDICGKVGETNYLCQTDLDFIDEARAVELGLPKDTRAVIHKCVRPGSAEGEYVPVKNEHEALKVAKDYCGCVSTRLVDTRAKCARKKDT